MFAEAFVTFFFFSGRGGGSVGRVVASDTSDLWFDPRQKQEFHEYIVNCTVEKTKIKEEVGKGPFKKYIKRSIGIIALIQHYNAHSPIHKYYQHCLHCTSVS